MLEATPGRRSVCIRGVLGPARLITGVSCETRMTTRFAILALSIVVCGCSITQKNPQEHSVGAWFVRQPPSYYSNLAYACDAVLRAQPVPQDSLYFVKLGESSLPKLITDLHPREVVLTSTTVSIGYSAGNDGFWIGWGPDEGNTNLWTLEANLKGGRKAFYAETRKPSS